MQNRTKRYLSIVAVAVLAFSVVANGTASRANAQVVCDASGGDAEGCYEYDDMFDFLDLSAGLVNGFIESNYPDKRVPTYTYIQEGGLADSACGGADDTSFHYCGLDGGVFVGQRLLYYFYSQSGDAAAAVAVAHEAGHHLQRFAGVRSRTLKGRIRQENQADCVAGAFVSYLNKQNILDVDDDIEDIAKILPLIASAEGPSRDHGTLNERSRAMTRGMSGGLSACNAYFPQTPIF